MRMIKISKLVTYPSHINCVEGNTTLYALPKAEIVSRWYEQTHDDFRFCFKFPATISHQAALRNCDDLSHEFFTRLAPLSSRIGQYWLQLPATFGSRDLTALWPFLDSLPREFRYGVEVRHPEFFAKGEAEQQLNRGLHQRNVNRVILDSRPVHSAVARSPAMIEAQKKKPKVPVHALVTAHNPMVRFIGSDDMTQNRELFSVWIRTLPKWTPTATPYLFLHTPDIAQAPELVDTLWGDLRTALPEIGNAPSIPQQTSLF
ncbi:DUF72 domain-containing protein [Klebsiella grimontii]|uniref:DUF72 domain-containing protein n=1 Tax=Klebsiella grimontii TaxID=2058152 RepID=UPI0012B968E8|nr:DUF72 domain-containing protein [Klebsiella grimontii]MBZ6758140.1 DUF72 domain-containing protein [Klebsiella grimontii]